MVCKVYLIQDSLMADLPPEVISGLPVYYQMEAGKAQMDGYRLRMLASGYLLYMIMGMTDLERPLKGDHGKWHPYKGIFYNISHDEGLTVLALADAEIGVDLEKVREGKISVVRRAFPEAYRSLWEEADDRHKKQVFTWAWTRVEAALKAEGSGFYLNPSQEEWLFDKWTLRTFRRRDFYLSLAMERPFEAVIYDVTDLSGSISEGDGYEDLVDQTWTDKIE